MKCLDVPPLWTSLFVAEQPRSQVDSGKTKVTLVLRTLISQFGMRASTGLPVIGQLCRSVGLGAKLLQNQASVPLTYDKF